MPIYVTAAVARAIHAAPASVAETPMATFAYEGGVGGKVNIHKFKNK